MVCSWLIKLKLLQKKFDLPFYFRNCFSNSSFSNLALFSSQLSESSSKFLFINWVIGVTFILSHSFPWALMCCWSLNFLFSLLRRGFGTSLSIIGITSSSLRDFSLLDFPLLIFFEFFWPLKYSFFTFLSSNWMKVTCRLIYINCREFVLTKHLCNMYL